MANIKKPFGMSVRNHRTRLGITQEELAERAGLHRTYVCDVERGARNVSLESIEKLARALEVSIPSLLSYSQDPKSGGLDPSLPEADGLLNILLIEDLSDDVDLTMWALKNANIANHIEVVRDGAEALSFLFRTGKNAVRGREQLPELILLDLGLPKIDGLEVLRQIKADPRTGKIPVIILTASTSQRNLSTCKRLGADAFIPKPVDFCGLSMVTPKLSLQWALLKPLNPAAGIKL